MSGPRIPVADGLHIRTRRMVDVSRKLLDEGQDPIEVRRRALERTTREWGWC
jgi:hypothetical protein